MERLRHPQLLKCSWRAGAAAPGHRVSRAAANQQRRPATRTWTSSGPLIRPVFHSSPKDPTAPEICGPFPTIVSSKMGQSSVLQSQTAHLSSQGGLGSQQSFWRSRKERQTPGKGNQSPRSRRPPAEKPWVPVRWSGSPQADLTWGSAEVASLLHSVSYSA